MKNMSKTVTLAALTACVLIGVAQAQTWDASHPPGLQFVQDIAVGPGGALHAAGGPAGHTAGLSILADGAWTGPLVPSNSIGFPVSFVPLRGVAVDGDGTAYVYDGAQRFVSLSGGRWTLLPTVTDLVPQDIGVDASGRLWAAGLNYGATSPRVSVFDGTSWASRDPDAPSDLQRLHSLALAPGRLYVGGTESGTGLAGKVGLCDVACQTSGSGWQDISPPASHGFGTVLALALGPEGELYAGGSTRAFNGEARVSVWDGVAWTLLMGPTEAVSVNLRSVTTLVSDGAGGLIVAGFVLVRPVPWFNAIPSHVAMYDGVGWALADPPPFVDGNYVRAEGLAVDRDSGFVYLGGEGVVPRPTTSSFGPGLVYRLSLLRVGLGRLRDLVEDLDLPRGTRQSLISKLDTAEKVLGDGNEDNDSAACGTLGAFVNSVEARRGKAISDADADRVIASAQALLQQLGCS